MQGLYKSRNFKRWLSVYSAIVMVYLIFFIPIHTPGYPYGLTMRPLVEHRKVIKSPYYEKYSSSEGWRWYEHNKAMREIWTYFGAVSKGYTLNISCLIIELGVFTLMFWILYYLTSGNTEDKRKLKDRSGE